MTQRTRTTNWDAVATAVPNDTVAGRVVSQEGEHYEAKPTLPEGYAVFDACPPLRDRRLYTVANRGELYT